MNPNPPPGAFLPASTSRRRMLDICRGGRGRLIPSNDFARLISGDERPSAKIRDVRLLIRALVMGEREERSGEPPECPLRTTTGVLFPLLLPSERGVGLVILTDTWLELVELEPTETFVP